MWRLSAVWLTGSLVLAGCGGAPGKPPADPPSVQLSEVEIRAAEFAKMEPAERAIAEAQGYCVVSEEPLGSMGVPYKVSIDDKRAVYVCCKGCEDLVKDKPEEMLAKAEELKAKVAAEKGAAPAASPANEGTEPKPTEG